MLEASYQEAKYDYFSTMTHILSTQGNIYNQIISERPIMKAYIENKRRSMQTNELCLETINLNKSIIVNNDLIFSLSLIYGCQLIHSAY